MATAIGMLTQTGLLGDRVIGLVNLNWEFPAPVRIGDTIRANVEVEDIRPTSKSGRDLAAFEFVVINQNGETVQRGRMLVVVHAERGER
jgi:acyl dehydratase